MGQFWAEDPSTVSGSRRARRLTSGCTRHEPLRCCIAGLYFSASRFVRVNRRAVRRQTHHRPPPPLPPPPPRHLRDRPFPPLPFRAAAFSLPPPPPPPPFSRTKTPSRVSKRFNPSCCSPLARALPFFRRGGRARFCFNPGLPPHRPAVLVPRGSYTSAARGLGGETRGRVEPKKKTHDRPQFLDHSRRELPGDRSRLRTQDGS